MAGSESISAARPEAAAHRAYAFVKERLLDGRYPGGTLLSENRLAKELGISRTPVRQAFLQLEVEDLLDLYPRRGALVKPISASEADDVLEARLLIEKHCARHAATRESDLGRELRDLLAEQERALSSNATDFILADRDFHRAIVAANGNRILTRQYDGLRDRLQRMAATAVAADPRHMATFIAEHREIAGAIERGDGRAAADLMASHLRRAHQLARRSRF